MAIVWRATPACPAAMQDLPSKYRGGSTWLGRKERAGLPWGGGSRQEVRSEHVLDRRDCDVPLLHRTNEVGEVSGRRISEAGGERLLPRPGNLMMQVREVRQLSPRRVRTRATEETLVGQAHTCDALTVLVVTRDEVRAWRVKVHSTHR